SIKVIERFFEVPLDYTEPNGKKIRVFARSLIPLDKAKTPEEESKLPYCGPGFEVDIAGSTSIATVTLWLDQRGTGLSTPFSADLVTGQSDEEITQYLKHFRADNIGGDARLSLKEVFITAGIPPAFAEHPDTVYRALEIRVAARNSIYYAKYPNDVQRVRDILAYLESNQVFLPNGGKLIPNRFLQLGIRFGGQEIVFRAANDLSLFAKLSQRLLQNIEQEQALDGNPLYALLHEAIYCQRFASNWSAARVLREHPQYSWAHMKTQVQSPVYFFGEMIFPDMFDDYVGLRPLKGAAQLLAEKSDWPPLYDQAQLAKNTVKVTAATYVDFDLAQSTAARVQNLDQYISNQHHHSALRRETEFILEKLFHISKREYD
ncbi:hypothetical protein H0H93_002975, partial [Arthromyces matolae]